MNDIKGDCAGLRGAKAIADRRVASLAQFSWKDRHQSTGETMKLDRNINGNGRGKYALLKLRKLDEFAQPDDPFQKVAPKIADAIKVLEDAGILDWGTVGTEAEFMLIRLKDKYAPGALYEYALAAERDGEMEFAAEVRGMAKRSGIQSPWCKKPD